MNKKGRNNRGGSMPGSYSSAGKYTTVYKYSTIHGISQGKKQFNDI